MCAGPRLQSAFDVRSAGNSRACVQCGVAGQSGIVDRYQQLPPLPLALHGNRHPCLLLPALKVTVGRIQGMPVAHHRRGAMQLALDQRACEYGQDGVGLRQVDPQTLPGHFSAIERRHEYADGVRGRIGVAQCGLCHAHHGLLSVGFNITDKRFQPGH